jgi:hypothetical protein
MLLRLSSMPLVLAYSVQSFNHRNLSLAIDQTRLNSVNLPSMHPHIKKVSKTSNEPAAKTTTTENQIDCCSIADI